MRDQRCLQVLESEAEILTEKNPTTSLSFPPFVLPRPAGLVAIACLRKKEVRLCRTCSTGQNLLCSTLDETELQG
jgi:hypothetical protein